MLDKEIKKEILTRDKIKIDLKNFCLHNLGLNFLCFLLTSLACVFLWITKSYEYPGLIIFCIMILIMWILSSSVFIKDIITFLQINKDSYRILTDKLIGLQKKTVGRTYHRPYTLHFPSYGKYGLREMEYYKWSEMFCIWNEYVYHSSDPGDEFYLITTKKEKILMVYNCKMFELKEETHT